GAWLARAVAPGGRAGPAGAGVPRADEPRGFAGILARFPLFQPRGGERLRHLTQGATERAYPAGHVIVSEGEFDDRVFVILSGRVRVVEAMADAMTEAVLGGLGEGEIFGELSTLTGRPRSA